MKYILTFILLLGLIIYTNLSTFSQFEKGTIRIEIHGFETDDGTARILIFSENEKMAFPSNQNGAYLKKIIPIKNNKVFFEFSDLPYGNYAISVHHDKNGDGKVNKNWVGIPNEGLGCTNDAKGFFAPPSFDQAKVNLNKKEITLKINMVN